MPTPKKKETYSQVMERLKKIADQMDNSGLKIDMLAKKAKRASEIITFYSDRLTKADKKVEKSLAEKQECEG